MKYHVRDEDGKEFEVEEIEKTTETQTDPVPNNTADDDNSALSSDEIASLKSLAAVADKLVSLVKTTTDEDEDEDEEEEEEEEEEVVETNDCDVPTKMKKVGDAKKSIGAIEKRKRAVDSVDEDEVAQAWQKRYNGGNN